MFTLRTLTRPSQATRRTLKLTSQSRPLSISAFKMAQNPLDAMTSSKNDQHIVDVIKQDHREIESYYSQIIKALDAQDNDAATRWQNQFTWELARHSIGEELVVYPVYARVMGEAGQQMADRDRAEHQVVKEDLKTFQNLASTDPSFRPTIEKLMKDLSKHIKEEEKHDLPLLHKNIEQAEGFKLARSFGRTKAFVPSRSHPSAPSKPPFETAVGLLTAPIDHLGDLFRKFPGDDAMPNPSTK